MSRNVAVAAAEALCRTVWGMLHWCFGVTRGDYFTTITARLNKVVLKSAVFISIVGFAFKAPNTAESWLDLPEHMPLLWEIQKGQKSTQSEGIESLISKAAFTDKAVKTICCVYVSESYSIYRSFFFLPCACK